MGIGYVAAASTKTDPYGCAGQTCEHHCADGTADSNKEIGLESAKPCGDSAEACYPTVVHVLVIRKEHGLGGMIFEDF